MRTRLRRLVIALLIALTAAAPAAVLESCGTLHTHWDMDHEYNFDEGRSYYDRPRPPKPPKPPKHKKHKKPKPPKHKKHHRHHDDHDD